MTTQTTHCAMPSIKSYLMPSGQRPIAGAGLMSPLASAYMDLREYLTSKSFCQLFIGDTQLSTEEVQYFVHYL